MFNDPDLVIASALDMQERRRVYHAYLVALRLRNPPGTEPQRSATLESLRRSLGLFTNLSERARAGCELAFTYQESGQTDAAATQFADAQNLKPSSDRPHERRGPPLPAGACAYWISATPFGPRARDEMSRIIEARKSHAAGGLAPLSGLR
jgi:hypothetical protein